MPARIRRVAATGAAAALLGAPALTGCTALGLQEPATLEETITDAVAQLQEASGTDRFTRLELHVPGSTPDAPGQGGPPELSAVLTHPSGEGFSALRWHDGKVTEKEVARYSGTEDVDPIGWDRVDLPVVLAGLSQAGAFDGRCLVTVESAHYQADVYAGCDGGMTAVMNGQGQPIEVDLTSPEGMAHALGLASIGAPDVVANLDLERGHLTQSRTPFSQLALTFVDGDELRTVEVHDVVGMRSHVQTRGRRAQVALSDLDPAALSACARQVEEASGGTDWRAFGTEGAGRTPQLFWEFSGSGFPDFSSDITGANCQQLAHR